MPSAPTEEATTNGSKSQPFSANLFTLRTLFVFAAGFAMALLLARTLPGAGLFHPEARVITKDIVIAAINGADGTIASVHGIATSEGEGFGGTSEVWDSDLLEEAVELAAVRNSFALDARITYVIPTEGPVLTIRIERRS